MKITTDDVGINVTWNRKVTYPRRRTNVALRVFNVLFVTAACILVPLWLMAGRWGLAIAWMLMAALQCAGFTLGTMTNRSRMRLAAEAARPQPDYALIARMEREGDGRTFHHADAPCRCDECAGPAAAPSWSGWERKAAAELSDKLDRLAGRPAIYIPRVEVPGDGAAPCAERGFHVYTFGSPACLTCGKDR